jgi:hypothetical protein
MEAGRGRGHGCGEDLVWSALLQPLSWLLVSWAHGHWALRMQRLSSSPQGENK